MEIKTMEPINSNPYQAAIPPEGALKVLWINPHPKWAYIPGNIVNLPTEKARELIEGEFVRLLSQEEHEQILRDQKPKPPVPESSYIKVKFLQAAPGFAYSSGDIGMVTPDNFKILFQNGLVELFQDEKPRGRKVLTRLFK